MSENSISDQTEAWSVEDSRALYRIGAWGAGYFDINDSGEVVVCPGADRPQAQVSLSRIVEGLRARGVAMPVLLRLPDLLDGQIRSINREFAAAIAEYGYQGSYRGVYPVKVNQQAEVLEEVARFGQKYGYGLEAGSKAEVIAALSYLDQPGDLLICNGYKDEKFIELGLYARQIGIDCVFVIETPIELDLIIKTSRRLNIRPKLGVRVRLASCASGHWKDSGGDRSVFGLNTGQLIDCVDCLRENDLLDCLALLHFHLGSQVPEISDVRISLTEACKVYLGLLEEGAPMGMLDIGGGLAIDYDGSSSSASSSCNYTLSEYCRDVVEVIKAQMNERGAAHPVIVTESGRATVAYYSVLLVDILDVNRFKVEIDADEIPDQPHQKIVNLLEVRKVVSRENLRECYNDAFYYRDDLRQMFKLGVLSLRERALGEKIFWDILYRIYKITLTMEEIPESLAHLEAFLSDIYYANFSLFQSLPDAWAIDQIFPIMPIDRLTEEPTRRAVISDITCDCDGKIDRFLGGGKVQPTLPVHAPQPDQDYILGVFLVGAYQETLGDLHNLLGDTNVVSVRLSGPDQFEVVRELEGDTVADVLSYVEYEPKAVSARFRQTVEKAVQDGRLSVVERRAAVAAFEEGLRGYTYFES